MFQKHIQSLFEALRPFQESVVAPPSRTPRETVRWGGVPLDAGQKLHYCLVGTTRSGKTTLLRILMQDALPPIKTRPNTRALIYDPKHEIHAVLDGLGLLDRTHTFDPFAADSVAWAIHEDVTDERSAEQVAATLVPKEKARDAGESFFSIALRNLVKAVICCYQRSGVDWTLRDLLLGLGDLEVLEELTRRHADTAQSYRNTIQRLETSQDIVASIENFRNRYRVIAALWHHASSERPPMSIRRWLTSESIIVLPGPKQEGDPVTVLNQLLFERIVEGILASPEVDEDAQETAARSWVIVDELRTAGELTGLEGLLSRSASKGCRIVLGIQAVEGLKDAQGENRAEELLGLCHNRAFLRAPSDYTAEWMSRQFSNRVIERAERSVSRSESGTSETFAYRRVEEPHVRAEAFHKLASPEWSDKLEGYFIAPGEKQPYYHSSVESARLFGGEHPLILRKGKAERSLRPSSQQILRSWELDDLHRLGLPPYFVGRLVPGQFDVTKSF